MSEDYARALGERLRAIRRQQGLSLHEVEERSQGRWKPSVVGSYERGVRALTVARLAELGEFYGVPVAELLPEAQPSRRGKPTPRLVINLQRLGELPTDPAGPLARFVAAIQSERGDYNGKVLTIRSEDLRSLSVIYDQSPEQLVEWCVLPADTEPERASVPERQPEGIPLAEKWDVHRGHRRSLTPGQVDELRRRAAAGEAKAALAREFGVSRETVYRYLRAAAAG